MWPSGPAVSFHQSHALAGTAGWDTTRGSGGTERKLTSALSHLTPGIKSSGSHTPRRSVLTERWDTQGPMRRSRFPKALDKHRRNIGQSRGLACSYKVTMNHRHTITKTAMTGASVHIPQRPGSPPRARCEASQPAVQRAGCDQAPSQQGTAAAARVCSWGPQSITVFCS